MKRKFRVTLWINGQPFHHFCKTIPEVLDMLETASGKCLSEQQRNVMIDVMVGMLMRETDVECSLTSEEKSMHISLAYVDPSNFAA